MSATHIRVRVAGEHYALPVEGVREIARRGRITPVPGAPPPVLGVWNLRGDLMAAVDLGAALGLTAAAEDGAAEAARIVVAELGELRAGLAVEAVVEVGPLPVTIEPADSAYLEGAVLVDSTLVGVVDLAAMLDAVAERVR
jgi:purine-binding chemotaxis protein CheW